MAQRQLPLSVKGAKKVAMKKTDFAIATAVAVILGAVVAASFTRAALKEPSHSPAAQDEVSSETAPLVAEGKKLFEAMCAGCHVTDKREGKYGPGFKGLSQAKKLPISGRDATEESIRAQLKSPIKTMPKFDRLTDQEIKSLVAYLLRL